MGNKGLRTRARLRSNGSWFKASDGEVYCPHDCSSRVSLPHSFPPTFPRFSYVVLTLPGCTSKPRTRTIDVSVNWPLRLEVCEIGVARASVTTCLISTYFLDVRIGSELYDLSASSVVEGPTFPNRCSLFSIQNVGRAKPGVGGGLLLPLLCPPRWAVRGAHGPHLDYRIHEGVFHSGGAKTVSSNICPLLVVFSHIIALTQSLTTSSTCLLYTSPSPRDRTRSRMPSSA